MSKLSRIERRASELDTYEMPMSDMILRWEEFNTDLYSTQLSITEVVHIINQFPDERIDLRPYMILSPYVCTTTDKFQKVLDMYRYMQLR